MTPTQVSLPVPADPAAHVEAPPLSTTDPAALIADGLDQNEHMRRQLVARRTTVRGEVARRLLDTAIGRLARVHSQLTRALADVEKAGGEA